jgi:NTE family protein
VKVALVLGSGGARGYAHIGVIEELEARGHQVAVVSGSSMGALVGGVYAAGQLAELKEIALGLSRLDMVRLMDPAINKAGLIEGKRVLGRLHQVVGNARIEDFAIPFFAVASDLVAGKEVWFDSGPLIAAIRASIAIPTVFSPVVIDDRVLVDGGVLNPLPVTPTLAHRCDAIIGVSLFARRQHPMTVPEAVPHHGLPSIIEETIGKLLPNHDESRKSLFGELPPDLDLFNATLMSLDLMQATIQQSRLGVNFPDVLIEVPVDVAHGMEFDRAEELIALGRDLAQQAFDKAGL